MIIKKSRKLDKRVLKRFSGKRFKSSVILHAKRVEKMKLEYTWNSPRRVPLALKKLRRSSQCDIQYVNDKLLNIL